MRALLLMVVLVAGAVPALADDYAAKDKFLFDLPAQSLSESLQAVARQAGLQILFESATVRPYEAPTLHGRMTVRQALDALLEGVPLEHARTGQIVVVRDHVQPPPQQAEPSETLIGEAVVTGTLLRGARSASPLIVFPRTALERAGFTTSAQVLQSLPQSFGGGDNEAAIASPGGSPLNIGLGSSINLRGLGSDATLVLLDGHRLAPAAFGQFVDLSLIPLSAVERVEVLTDGASATYGSDAVAGVVNFVLRDEVTAPETRLRGGAATDGSLDEYQFSQSLGGRGEAGQAHVVVDLYRRSNLDASDRGYAAQLGQPFDLLPAQESASVMAGGSLALGEGASARATALFSERDADWRLFNTATREPTVFGASTRNLATFVGGDLALRETWRAKVDATYSRTDTDRDVATSEVHWAAERNESQLLGIDARIDGDLFATSSGAAKLALGVGVRQERYARTGRTPVSFAADRLIESAFAEVLMPLGSATLSLAARHERYSDFGSTSTPKVGLTWSPFERLTLRGTFGRSFRAPTLDELDNSNVSALLLEVPDGIAADGSTLALLVTGNNSALKPEKATTWTAGVDFEPLGDESVEIALTYFDTSFGSRIVAPLPGLEVLSVFDQADIYHSLIEREPDRRRVDKLIALPTFVDLFGAFAPEDVEAIIDRRLQNISVTHVRGLDLRSSGSRSTQSGDWAFRLALSYLIDYEDAITSAAPAHDVLGTAYHPVDLRGRAELSWERGALSAFTAINHVGGLVNDTLASPVRVPSWSTVDIQLVFRTPPRHAWWDGMRFVLDVTNALNRSPPQLVSPAAQYQRGFDPTNASALGRLVSVAAIKAW